MAETQWQPGRTASDLVLIDSSASPISIAKLTSDLPLLLVIVPPISNAAVCQAATALGQIQLFQQPRRAAVVLGKFPPEDGCNQLKQVSFYQSPRLDLGSEDKVRPLFAAIVDESQHVRWSLAFANTEAGWKAVSVGVNAWYLGRQSFEANCGHCHGLDGAQASSPDVKPLIGITKKYPENKVLELGAQFGGVDMTGWNQAKRETLLTYIRGL